MASLRRYAGEELATRSEVREAILIGSLAQDNWSARSDADIVLIVEASHERGPLRGAGYAPRRPVGVAVDVLVYTPEEATRWGPRFRAEVEAGVGLYRRA